MSVFSNQYSEGRYKRRASFCPNQLNDLTIQRFNKCRKKLSAHYSRLIAHSSLLTALCLPVLSYGQISPGGVNDPAVWIKTQTLENGVELINAIDKKSLIRSNADYRINNNPAIKLDGGIPIKVEYRLRTNAQSFFPVYKNLGSEMEQLVWFTSSDNKIKLVQTNKRIADITRHGVINLLDANEDKIQLHAYQNVGNNNKEPVLLNLNTIVNFDLPVGNFNGLFPEMVVYDRLLSQEERLRVETYLSLKYGVSLTQHSGLHSYLGSDGSLLFDNEKIFLDRIAGLAFDPASGLQQTKSCSEEDGFFSMEVKGQMGTSPQYLIWGDDDGTLIFEETSVEKVEELGRKWKIQYTNWGNEEIIMIVDLSAFNIASNESISLKVESKNGREVIDGEKTGIAQMTFNFTQEEVDQFTFIKGTQDRMFNFVNISPNPTSGLFQVEYEKNNVSVPSVLYIWDVSGTLIKKQNLGSNKSVLIEEFIEQSGVYFIEIRTGEHSHTQKIIVI